MGTHPIFESDFDCLTECQTETLEQIPKGIPGTRPEMDATIITTIKMARTTRQKLLTSITLLLMVPLVGTTTTTPDKHRPVSTTTTPTPAVIADWGGSCRISS